MPDSVFYELLGDVLAASVLYFVLVVAASRALELAARAHRGRRTFAGLALLYFARAVECLRLALNGVWMDRYWFQVPVPRCAGGGPSGAFRFTSFGRLLLGATDPLQRVSRAAERTGRLVIPARAFEAYQRARVERAIRRWSRSS